MICIRSIKLVPLYDNFLKEDCNFVSCFYTPVVISESICQIKNNKTPAQIGEN